MKFNVSEIFFSVQCEGPDCGFPAIFVRFSGCNLRCKWGDNFCDTPYTSWKPELKWMEQEELIKAIQAVSEESRCRYVILTGGEPTIQPGFNDLVDHLYSEGYLLALESNGTKAIASPHKFTRLVLSPKLSDSVPVGTEYEKMHDAMRKKVIEAWKDCSCTLKFVVGKNTNMEEIDNLVKEIGEDDVWLMPEGVTREDVLKNQEYVIEMCKIKGYKFSSRLHILIWDKKRGV